MEVKNILVSEAYTNCYLVKNEKTNEGFIVDPGDAAFKIAGHINTMQMKPKAILLTHGHYDHIGAAKELKDKYDIDIYCSNEEVDLLADPRVNLSNWFGANMTLKADHTLSDGQEIEIAGIKMKFILTPGHTKGSGCYYVEDENILFSGDTLFCMSRGRTDFPGGSEREILDSIRNKLLTLPGNTTVFPGHNEETSIEYERRFY